MQPTTDKIFVSYSRHDEAFAKKIAIWLSKTLNMGVWIDVDDIPPGVKWSAAIQDGLDNCEVMVVILTPESMESVNVEDEWQYFIDLGKPVVPILLRTTSIPYQLRRIQWIDFSDSDDYNNSLRQLIVELRQQMKPLEGERRKKSKSKHPRVAESKKSKKTRHTIGKAEELIDLQSKALKRSNRLMSILAFLLFVIVIGAGGFGAWWYFNLPAQFTIRGDTTNAFALLPGAEAPVSLASLNGEAPVGTLIQTGDEPITLYSEGGVIEAVLQANTAAAFNDLTDDNIAVEFGPTGGNISAETNGARGFFTLPNGIDIELNNNIEVAIDPETDEVTSSCFEGSCTVTDTQSGESIDLEQGQSLTFSNSAPNLSEAILRVIPGEIAYVTNQHGASEIYFMRPDGSNPTRFTNNTGIEDESPAWSPDGEFLAFVSNRGGRLDIWRISSTGEEEPLNLTDNFSQDKSPAWSPDGTRIAFVSNRVNGVDDIYILNADGTGEAQRITLTGGNASPSWSPDSTRIAFSSNRGGDVDIYVLDLSEADSEPVNVSNHRSTDTDPAWSHDGDFIAFVSNRDNNEEIYIQDITSDSESINVSHNSGRDFEPVWSPDSRRVMFTSERFGDLDIISVSINVDATATDALDVKRLTDDSSESDQEAVWLPVIRAGQ